MLAALQSSRRCAKARAMIRRALTNTGWLMGARGINAVLKSPQGHEIELIQLPG